MSRGRIAYRIGSRPCGRGEVAKPSTHPRLHDPRPQHRHDRLRLHGPLPLQRLPHRPELLRPPAPPGPQGRLRPRRGEDAGLRRPLGLRDRRDRLAQADRAPRHRPRRHLRPQRPPRRDRHRRGRGRQGGHHREAARPHHRRRRARWSPPSRRPASPNLVCYNYRRMPAVTLVKQVVDSRQARPHLPLPRQVPAGLDHLARRPAGRRRHLAPRRRGRGLRRHRRPPRPLPRHRASGSTAASRA